MSTTDDDPLTAATALLIEAEQSGRAMVALPVEPAPRALLERASKSGRPRLSKSLQLREQGWLLQARGRKRELMAEGKPGGAALQQAAEELVERFKNAGSRRLAVSTVRRMIEG